jgi:hypothetical protein
LETVAANPGMLDVVAAVNVVLSATWNSYVRVPAWLAVALRTVSTGRSVSSCSSFAGDSRAGVVSVGATGVGAFGVCESPPHAAASRPDAQTSAVHVFMSFN